MFIANVTYMFNRKNITPYNNRNQEFNSKSIFLIQLVKSLIFATFFFRSFCLLNSGILNRCEKEHNNLCTGILLFKGIKFINEDNDNIHVLFFDS